MDNKRGDEAQVPVASVKFQPLTPKQVDDAWRSACEECAWWSQTSANPHRLPPPHVWLAKCTV